MRTLQGAAALVLASTIAVVFGQECPPGYAKGKIDWQDCGIENSPLECATIQVPRDWTVPNSDKLDLRLVRYPAAKGTINATSIIMNPGGPGASGINQVRDGGYGYQQIAGNNFHIIGFDPRGVGLSDKYNCPKNTKSQGFFNTNEGRSTALKYFQDQAGTCADQQYKSDLVGTTFVARDINAIVEQLGEDQKIRYWGFSYGTLLGTTLATMFPDKIARLVIDGNINPIDYYYGLGDETTADFDKGVLEFFRQCAAAPAGVCAVAEDGKTGLQLQQKFDAEIEEAGFEASDEIRDQLFQAMYFRKANTYIELAKNISNWYKTPKPSSRKRKVSWPVDYDEEAAEWKVPLALDAITCGDLVNRPIGTEEKFKEWFELFTKVGNYHSKYSGDTAVRSLYQCSTWRVDSKEKVRSQFRSVKTAHPILVLQTMFDPVTPYASAKNVSDNFIDSRLLVSSGVGHCTSANPSPELNKAIGVYLQTGKFPDVNVVYKPNVENVFQPSVKRIPDAPQTEQQGKRDFVTPRIWRNKPSIVRRQDNIPAGCTKIAASSTPVASATSSAVVSSLSSVVASSTAVASASSSTVGSASSSAIVSVSSSAMASASSGITSGSSSAVISNGASVISSAVPSSSDAASLTLPSNSALTASSSAGPAISVSTVQSSPNGASTVSSVNSAVPSLSLSSMFVSATSNAVNPSSTGAIGGASSSLISVSGGSAVASVVVITSPYGNGYPAPSGPSSKASSVNNSNGDILSSGTAVTSSPYPTLTWSSQPGYVPITQTYTTTQVQIITQCRGNQYCPLNSATPTAVITKTETRTNVVAVPSTTVYVTQMVDVCSTGLTTSTLTVTETCKQGCTTRPTGPPPGWTTTVKYCNACATPSTVTVTYCATCINKPSSAPVIKSTPAPPPQGPTKPASVPGYGPSMSSRPAVPVSSVSSKPSMPVGNTTTTVQNTPAIGTPATSTTLQINPASTGGYGCSGANCPTTTKSVLQFTGAASHEHAKFPLVIPAIFAGLAFFL